MPRSVELGKGGHANGESEAACLLRCKRYFVHLINGREE